MTTNKTITSANAVFILRIPNLYNAPIQLQGWSSDTAFTLDGIAPSETVMGVDGKLSAGYTPQPIKQRIQIMPDQDSVGVFDQWFEAMKTAGDVFFAEAVITLPSIQKSYTLKRGALTMYKQVPDAKKVLQAQEYEITWESSTPSSATV